MKKCFPVLLAGVLWGFLQPASVQASELYKEGIFTRSVFTNGFILGITLFLLAFLVIGILFMNKIRKTHKLIEEEYSLQNIHLPSPDDDEDNLEDK